MFCQLPEMLRNLLGQLTSRRQDQRGSPFGAPLKQSLKQRNAESRGFTAAGRSARKDVAAGQSNGNGRSLYRRGLCIVKVGDAASYGSIQREF